MKRISRLITKIQLFFDNLLGDSHSVSLKRFIGLCAFALFSAVTIFTLFKPLTAENVNLLKVAMQYLSGIIAVAILGVTATDIFKSRNE